MNLKTLAVTCILMSGILSSVAQTAATVKYGDITAADFSPHFYPIDSSAEAVILYDGGSAKYEGNSDGWFDVVYTYHRRIRILNKNAFDLATVEVPLFRANDKTDDIEKMEAATYSLENGQIVKTKLDKSSVFKDKVTSDVIIKKFTFPNLKEGCIIEYSYTVISPRPDFLAGWEFQDKYPVLQSTYETYIPTVLNFVFLNTGNYDLQPATDQSVENFRLFFKDNSSAQAGSEVANINTNVVHSKWSLSNLPAMVKEKYTTTTQNYISRIEFQLRSVAFPGRVPQPVMQTWTQLSNQLLKSEKFGSALSEKNSWLDDDLAPLTVKNDSLQTAQKIYSFVQQNFSCLDHNAITVNSTLKTAYKERKGNVAEINLILTAMLRRAGITSDPVLLSTKDNGFAYEEYPLINKFNYVITRAEIGGIEYLLDASHKKIGFNHLPYECYNGYARIINKETRLIPLFADSLKESKTTTIFISNDADGKKMSGSFNSDLGYYESLDLRNNMTATGQADFFKNIKSSYVFDINMENTGIDSLNNYNDPISVHYDFTFTPGEDIIYFNPLMSEGYKSNPFSAATRSYPVEMPYATGKLIVVNMDIPKGYKVDELPKSEKLSLNDAEGIFEYLIRSDGNMIQIKCRVMLNKANFTPDDYDTLRSFFAEIVKKEGEQIVFKKIK